MTKQEFITQLREKLCGLPQADIEESVIFYSEMIDDRIEDGLSEADAVNELGSVDDITTQIIADTPLSKIVKEKIRSRKNFKTWKTILLAVGSPIWVALVISAAAVIFSLWVTLWAVIVSLWAADVAFAATALGSFVSGFFFICGGKTLSGLFMISAGFICAGLFIVMLFICIALTKLSAKLTKKIVLAIKSLFIGKEEA